MRFSIHNKILISFCLVVFLGLFSLQVASYRFTEQNMNQIINNDMISSKKNIDLYLKQYFMIYDLDMNSATLHGEAENISKVLSSEFGNNVTIFDQNGEKTFNMDVSIFPKDESGLEKALNGEINYAMNYLEDKVWASLTYPIKVNNEIVGIVRYYRDYTDLYDNNERFKNITNLVAFIIFIIIFITSFVLAKIITRPVRTLIKNSEQIAKGNFDVEIKIKSNDEVGELAKRFTIMIKKIKKQIEFINKDRDNLKALQMQNKQFFDNVSHEMKTPLTTILGYAQVLQDNGFTDKDFFDKGLSYIISESERLNKLIVEVLEISRTSAVEFSYEFMKVDLSNVIEKTCDEMRIKGERYGIELNVSVQENLFIQGDDDRLKEVIINIVDNSLKYGDPNSVVNILAYQTNDSIFVSIKDTGEGIPNEYMDHVFDPFYKVGNITSKDKGSVGLGLSIVKNIVEKHGGTITINSKEKEGTEVILEFRRSVNE